MAETNLVLVGKAMEALKTGLAPFVERVLTNLYGEQTQGVLRQVRNVQVVDSQQPFRDLDTAALLKVMLHWWDKVFRDILGRDRRNLLYELREARNHWAHQKSFTANDTYRVLDSACQVLTAVSAVLQAEEVRGLRTRALMNLAGEQRVTQEQGTAVTSRNSRTPNSESEVRKSSLSSVSSRDDSIVAIVCAASKRDSAGVLRDPNGKPVRFVARPLEMPYEARDTDYEYVRPDDLFDGKFTWRQRLADYNQEHQEEGRNPYGLLPAYELYSNPVYRRLVEVCGIERVYILSAGWGLISASYLIPQYDITFSPRAEKWKRRGKREHYSDECHLPNNFGGTVEFFGGKEYAEVFAELTKSLNCRKIVRFNSTAPPNVPGCELLKYQSRAKTNWYYQCAKGFIDGQIDC